MLKKKFFKTKDECEVTFEINVADAENVALVCEANGWEPIPMKKLKQGPFRTKVRLPKEGEFQFRYLINTQEWRNDETADAYRPNEYGEENSVVSTFSAS
jgi:1,4-alpha-glucan branching enzyme